MLFARIFFCFIFTVQLFAGECLRFLIVAGNPFSFQSGTTPILGKDYKRSHLKSEELREVLDYTSEDMDLYYPIGRIYNYIAQVSWDKSVDSPHYNSLFEKRFLLSRDLMKALSSQNPLFSFVQSELSNGDLLLMGALGHFVYFSKENGLVYKGTHKKKLKELREEDFKISEMQRLREH
jgi:hypothetical protein